MLIVIVEDEPLIQQRIARLTKEILIEHQPKIVCFDELDTAESYIAEHAIDLLLLDLNLMGQSGFTLLQTELAEAFHTIIISAYADKAIEAFEYGVLDFIAKPFSPQRLSQAFDRVIQNQKSQYRSCRFLSVKKPSGIELVPVEQLTHIRADGHYSELHVKNDTTGITKTELHNKNIEKIEQLLPDSFLRVHRSYIVNMHGVVKLKIQEGSKYSLLLKSHQEIPIGRTKYEAVKRYMQVD